MHPTDDIDEVEYLSFDDVLDLFAAIQACSRTQARLQLRDEGGLQSAVYRPRNYAAYGESDIAMLAASLAHGIAEGQYFLDGNKRLALAALLAFLRTNAHDIADVTDNELAAWILDLSAGVSVAGLADQIRPHLIAFS